MGMWPIVPRTGVTSRLVPGLERAPARAQMVRGASGIGKTTVAAAVASTLAARGRTVVPIVALAELRDVPLGALTPLLSASSVATHGDVTARLSELMAVVGRNAGDYLLVVDDAPLLDEASAAALYQLVRVFAVPALLTARDEHELTGPVARLLHENLVDVLDLDGLTLEETRTVLSRHLGDQPRPDSLQRLYSATRGNPLFLRELTLAAERAHRVTAGPNGVDIAPARVPSHVIDTVAGRLQALSAEQRALAELVAVAQPWPRRATDASEEHTLDDLIDAGVLSETPAPATGFLHLSHPIYAEALLSALSAAERDERRRAAASRLLLVGEPALRFAALCLLSDASAPLDADDLLWAAEYALLAGDHARAAQASRRAVNQRPDARATLVHASALSALGTDLDAADAAFSRAAALAEQSGDEEDRALVAVRWGQHTALRRHDPAEAARRASALLPTLTPAGAAVLAPDLAKWRLMAGDASALDEPFVAHGDDESAAALGTAIGTAMMATMAGHVAEAQRAVEAGRPLADRFAAVQPFAAGLLDLSTFLVRVGEGRIAEATEFAEQRRLDPFADTAGVWSYALALVHLHAGRPADALPLALLAVQQLRWRDIAGLLGAALALAATVHAQRAEVPAAEALLAELTDAQRADVKVVMQEAEARAWLALVDDDRERALAIIAPAVASGVELGHLLLAALTGSTALRLGAAGVVRPALDAAAAATPSPLVQQISELAKALDERDATAVLDGAAALKQSGLVACVHGALLDAITWPTTDRMLERRLRVAAAELGAVVEPVRSIRSLRSEAGLTEREWDIARAAARRERSREIAERLGVSVRTVDNHLASVYRKLGVSGRTELEHELRELL